MISEDLQSASILLRYMNLEKFLDLICRARIYVARADCFDDPFEGNYTQLIYEISREITTTSNGTSSNQGMVVNTKEIKESAFISCWTLGDSENMALWKLYGGKNSIAIQTTVGILKHEINEPKNNNGVKSLLDKRIIKVDYIDHKSIDENLARELLAFRRSPLTRKPIAYSYEQEVRAIIDHLDHRLPDLQERLGKGIDIVVNPQHLIQKIYVSPLADDWFFKLLLAILKDHGMDGLVSWSNMRMPPVVGGFDKQN
jgi:hypothetical protein